MILPSANQPLPQSGNNGTSFPAQGTSINNPVPVPDTLPVNVLQAYNEEFLALLRCNDNTDEYD